MLNLVTGKGSAMSESLTGDPYLNALTFTGSGEVGTRLRHAVADCNVKVQLELGGKNPVVVHADADLAAAAQIVRGAVLYTGQRCTALSRVYVERAAAQAFRKLMVDEVAGHAVVDPYDEGTDVAPLVSAEQRDRVSRYLEIAREEKADVVVEEDPCRQTGFFLASTVLSGIAPDSVVLREEIFGPVLVVEEMDVFDDALRAANDTELGRSSAIFTINLNKAMAFFHRTQSGLVHINWSTSGVKPHIPFGVSRIQETWAGSCARRPGRSSPRPRSFTCGRHRDERLAGHPSRHSLAAIIPQPHTVGTLPRSKHGQH